MQKTIKRLSVWAIIIALVLMIPLVANWPWTAFDFVFASILFFGAAFAYEMVARIGDSTTYRLAVGLAVAAGVLLIWINGAVGIIGDEGNSATLMYWGVIAIGLISTLMAHFEPRKMTRAMLTTAFAQFIIPLIALVFWKPQITETPGVLGVFILNTFFVLIWIGSATLFRNSSLTKSK
jgi:hypothetical protein